jgi:putative tricarboxylic transport membrane protein
VSQGQAGTAGDNAAEADAASGKSHVASLIACLALTSVYLVASLGLPMGDASRPGGGFFPTVVGVLGVTASAAALGQEWRRRGPVRDTPPDTPGWLRRTGKMAILVGIMATYIVAAPLIGQTLASALVLAGLLRMAQPRPWWQIMLFAFLFALAVTFLFENVLGMRLPSGRLVNVL